MVSIRVILMEQHPHLYTGVASQNMMRLFSERGFCLVDELKNNMVWQRR